MAWRESIVNNSSHPVDWITAKEIVDTYLLQQKPTEFTIANITVTTYQLIYLLSEKIGLSREAVAAATIMASKLYATAPISMSKIVQEMKSRIIYDYEYLLLQIRMNGDIKYNYVQLVLSYVDIEQLDIDLLIQLETEEILRISIHTVRILNENLIIMLDQLCLVVLEHCAIPDIITMPQEDIAVVVLTNYYKACEYVIEYLRNTGSYDNDSEITIPIIPVYHEELDISEIIDMCLSLSEPEDM